METLDKLRRNGIRIEAAEIAEICTRFRIKEFAFFGSSLRSDFSDTSDIDVLVSFGGDPTITLFDIIDLGTLLEEKFQRPVDVLEKEALRNPIRKKKILETSEIVYAA